MLKHCVVFILWLVYGVSGVFRQLFYPPESTSRNHALVIYGDQRYKLHIHRGAKAFPLLDIKDDHGNSVLHQIEPFMGPNKDFYISSMDICPEALGFEELTFETLRHGNVTVRGKEKFQQINHFYDIL